MKSDEGEGGGGGSTLIRMPKEGWGSPVTDNVGWWVGKWGNCAGHRICMAPSEPLA